MTIENHPSLGTNSLPRLNSILTEKSIKDRKPTKKSEKVEKKEKIEAPKEKNKETIYLVDGHVAVAIDKPETTASGIVLPPSIKHGRPNVGYILYTSANSALEAGQKVMFLGWQEPIEYQGEEFFIIHEDDIKAVIV